MRKLGFKQSVPKQGYRLAMRPIKREMYNHFFCGLSEVKGAISPYTGKPLLRFLSLDARDPKLELEFFTTQRIELLYSLTCKLSYDDLFYKTVDDRIEILKLNIDPADSEEVFTDTPYLEYPTFFSSRQVELISVDENERVIVKSINETQDLDLRLQYPDLSCPYHQIGGKPYFVQEPEVLSCPDCGNDMSFFASIGNYNGQEKGFFDNDYMQVIYQICNNCSVIGAYNLCD